MPLAVSASNARGYEACLRWIVVLLLWKWFLYFRELGSGDTHWIPPPLPINVWTCWVSWLVAADTGGALSGIQVCSRSWEGGRHRRWRQVFIAVNTPETLSLFIFNPYVTGTFFPCFLKVNKTFFWRWINRCRIRMYRFLNGTKWF